MKRGKRVWLVSGGLAVLAAAAGGYVLSVSKIGAGDLQDAVAVDRPADIRPDYAGATIPPNVAPLNFLVCEPGDRFHVKIHAGRGQAIEEAGQDGKIVIPPAAWKKLLAQNRGGEIYFDVYARQADGRWRRFQSITNTVAEQEIDPYLVYRRIAPVYNRWGRMSIVQRHLESYAEGAVIENRHCDYSCLNCHTFLNNQPQDMLFHLRGGRGGTPMVLARGGRVEAVDSRTPYGGLPAAYAAWHPSGKLAVFSVNSVRQFFHNAGGEVREVLDLDSALACYRFDEQKMQAVRAISAPDRMETYPTWSPDGKYLYYCSAAIPWKGREKEAMSSQVRYDLLRVAYDVEKDAWSTPEVVLSAQQTGLSITLPRISPEGRWLAFCMSDYGCFPIYRPSSDLYIMDLSGGQYRPMTQLNSPRSESWHCWSSNGRWLAFSSKRRDGLFTRTYLAYIDSQGRERRAFILPQEDPTFYDAFTLTYSVPELIKSPVTVSERAIVQALRSLSSSQEAVAITSATPQAGPAEPYTQHP